MNTHASHVDLRASLDDLMGRIHLVECNRQHMQTGSEAIESAIRNRGQAQTVILCGAGISIPGPSHAPGFVAIRNALIESCVAQLFDREVLSSIDVQTIRDAVQKFPRLPGFELPPELLFSNVEQFLGTDTVVRLLSCLAWGKPNSNHYVLGSLLASGSVRGIITTNFDTYIEDAYSGPLRPILPRSSVGTSNGPRFVKPHGSLCEPDTIITTLEGVVSRLDPNIVRALRPLLTNAHIVVVGYSGYDYDLLPLLAYAASSWGSSFSWVLWDESSYNDRITAIQLALPGSIELISAAHAPLFTSISGAGKPENVERAPDIAPHFQGILESSETASLIGVVQMALGAIGLGDDSANDALSCALFKELRASQSPPTVLEMRQLLHLTQLGRQHALSDEFFGLARERAARFPDNRWHRYFGLMSRRRGATAEDNDNELAESTFRISERFWPGLQLPVNAVERFWPSLRLMELVSRLANLRRKGAYSDAVQAARCLLESERFPSVPMLDQSFLTFDTKLEGTIRDELARALFAQGTEAEAAQELSRAMNIFVRELSCFDIVHAVSQAERVRCIDCGQLAREITKRIPRVAGMVWDELVMTSIWLANGHGSAGDLERVRYLMDQHDLTLDERAMIEGWLSRANY